MNLKFFHTIAYLLYSMHIPILPKVIYFLQFLLFNSSVPASAKIGRGTIFGYGGIGTVIHGRAVIGENCVISQNVTIGGRSKQYNVPRIGNHVYIGAGAKILGDITIGNNIVIGANAVVISDIPSNSVVAGIPAKIIKHDININDIEDF